MQKNIKRFNKAVIFSLIVSILLMPFHVLAELNYKQYQTGGCVEWGINTGRYYVFNATSDFRFVRFGNTVWGITDSVTGRYQMTNNNNSFPNCGSNPSIAPDYTTVIDGITYKGFQNTTVFTGDYFYSQIPVINDTNNFSKAIYYTFGEGAGEPDLIYGELLTGFYTSYATRGANDSVSAMGSNLDTITWDDIDSLGNSLAGISWYVHIRAIPISWESSLSRDDLLSQLTNDMIINQNEAADIVTIGANRKFYSVTWREVASKLPNHNILEKLFPQVNENKWIEEGWVYQIRLENDSIGYVGEWQTIYNSTSYSPQNTGDIMNYYYTNNGTGLDPGVVNSINEVNNINNTTNNWYVDNTTINMSDSEDKPWWSYLLEAILSLLEKILDFFGGIFDGFIDLLLGLFDGFDPVGSFFDWFSNLKLDFESIDITLPQFNLPELTGFSEFYILPRKTLDLFINNNLGFIIFIPFLLLILRLFL